MILKKICLAALLSMLAFAGVEAKAHDTVSKQRETVVAVYVNDRNDKRIDSGAGFIVDPDGVIVTTCRPIGKWVSESGATLSVEVEGKGRFPVDELISSRCENNLALLKIKAAGLQAAGIARNKPVRGEAVAVFKGISNKEIALSYGKIRSVSERSGVFQVSLVVKQEDSGSPLFNAKGEVVGALIAQTQGGKNYNFAVSLNGISRQLDRYVKPKNLIERSISHPRTERGSEKKTDDIHEYYSRGCAYDQSNNYREAVEAYRQSLKINPDFVDAYINLGIDYYRLGKYDDAIDVFKQAIQIKPDVVSVYTKLGAAYMLKGEYSSAIDVLKKAVDIEARNASAHFNLGIAYFLSGDNIAAERECAVLKGLDKTKADSLIDLMY